MKKTIAVLLAAVLLALTGCSRIPAEKSGANQGYTQISQDEAMKMMQRDDGHIIVDVRRQDECDAGHIPGAILIPNESIGTEPPDMLPELNQIILIYCRSGNRSKQAAQKLSDMGYTNVYEFGGIIGWAGDVVTNETPIPLIWSAEEQPVRVRYDRTWIYSDSAETSDPETIEAIVETVKALKPGQRTDEITDDYTDMLTFTFPDGGMLHLTFEAQNWLSADGTRYRVEGLDRLRGLLEDMMNDELAKAVRPVPSLLIEANGHVFHAVLESNSSADALLNKLSSGAVELELHDYGSFEKVGPLPWNLPRNDEQITTEPGDVILYQGNQITIYYDVNTWNFTRLARISDVTRENLLAVMGDGNVTVTLRIEWSE